jgi:hypothetical protein
MSRKFAKTFYRKSRSLHFPIYLVVCEGDTEVDYLRENAKSLAKTQKKLHLDPSTNMHDLIDRFYILKKKQAI